MNRNVIFIKEDKKTIDKIKSKYGNLEMNDATALKISKLDTTLKTLKVATTVVGFITFVDLIIPDPVLGLDEAALASITGLLGYSSSLVNNKIDNLVKDDTSKFTKDDIVDFAKQLGNVYDKVESSKTKKLVK